jgi:amino acid adenylation domain-containing protein
VSSINKESTAMDEAIGHQLFDSPPNGPAEMRGRSLVRGFNDTVATYPQNRLIHQLFEEQAWRTPEAIAVVHGERSLTYSQLDRRANMLARYLVNEGVRPDRLVAICVGRSIEMVVGLLGILKAGGAYVPLDPDYPTERLRHMLQDSKPQMVLAHAQLRAVLPDTPTEVVELDAKLREIAWNVGEKLSSAELGLTSEHLVYVIYTSGSTGKPKGIAMSHRSMVNLIEWHRRTFPVSEGRRVLQFAALSFDVAFQETFSTLCTGGTLVLLDEWVRRDAHALMELLIQQSIHRLFVPPLVLQSLAESSRNTGLAPRTLEDVITAGEPLRVSPAIAAFFERMGECRLHNHYGPTETHVVTALTMTGSPAQWPRLPTIGRPIANTQIHVLDDRQQPVPVDAEGEIYIGGAGVARGYWGLSDLTAQRFIKDPFSRGGEGRLYRTGDLGRWRPDGTLEYLGRNDDQVKIRGFRIELREIETQLGRHQQVKEAAVVVREDRPGEKRLVAYVTLRTASDAAVAELRAQLQAVLPEHMVPRAFVVLEKMPLTPNGKLDRRALPEPDLSAYVSRDYEAPQGEVEEVLAAVWKRLLAVERVGRNDDFFELGGHSMLVVQMMDELRRSGLSAEGQRVFEHPTLADLAGKLTRGAGEQLDVPPNLIGPDCGAITPQMVPLVELRAEHIERIVQSVPGGSANIQDIYPLAPLQEGILFHHLLDRNGGDAYVLPVLFSLSSAQRLQELIRALQDVIDRHDILRTAIVWEHLPAPVQVVHRRAALPVERVDLDRNRQALEELKDRMRPQRQRLDLRRAPLMRLQVATDSETGQQYALLQLHHLVGDHESLEILLLEVRAHLEGRHQSLPEPLPYRNHVAQALASARRRDSESFFRNKLGDLTEPTVPFGLANVRGDGSQLEEARLTLDPELARTVRARARRLGVSPAMLFHAAWALVVSRSSARDDVVFGTLLLGRLHGSAGARRTLGMFINTLPLRIRLRNLTARALIVVTQRELVELLGHEQASLSVAQRCSGIADSGPLFSALLNYRYSRSAQTAYPMTPGIEVLASLEWTNYPIVLSVDDLGDVFVLEAQTDRSIAPHRLIELVSTAIRSLVEALESAPDTPALALSILCEHERQRVLESFNATLAAFPAEKLVHQLFEEQMGRTPQAVAAIYENRQLTYSDLNKKANQLARYLRGRGVGAGQVVAICMERGLEMLVGLLGVLKAGSAYVPLDPGYPVERLEHMLKDAAPQVVLTQRNLVNVLPAVGSEVLELDARSRDISKYDDENLSTAGSGVTADDLVYVIYTSGSTGRPKGTAMAHRSMVNLIEWHRCTFPNSEGQRVLQFAALSFDVAFQEILSTLCTGGALVLLDEWTRKDARALSELLIRRSVERLFMPPLMLQSLAEYAMTSNVVPRNLRDIITAGEQLRITPQITAFFKRLSGCRLHNHYGPTETHVVTALTLEGDAERWPVLPGIGRPISNSRIYVLDSNRQPLPTDVAGEIYIGGVAVARGYLRQPELTAQRFIRDPFSADPQARLYATGDVGLWRADGTLEYLGRNDHQVKIRGYRIELGEIEAQLAQLDQVKEAAVIVREDEPGEKRLVAYVTLRDPHVMTTEALRRRLQAVLPKYMVPGACVILEQLPLTPNGKLDRSALQRLELEDESGGAYEAPQGEGEEALARIWQELLRVQRIGRDDDFFQLGGHSLLATRLAARICTSFSAEVPIRDLFASSTLREMANRVDHLRQARVLEKIADGGSDVEGLLEKVASMSETKVQELMRTLRMGGRP